MEVTLGGNKMAIETLEGIDKIGGFNAVRYEKGKEVNTYSEQEGMFPISINHDTNCISFRIQDGPIKENGVNGCQVDTLIETAKIMIEGLNKKFPCKENAVAITKLDEALMWLEKRKKDRIKRNVEGLSKL